MISSDFPRFFEARWTENNVHLKKSFVTTQVLLLIGSLGLFLAKSRKMAALTSGALLAFSALKYIFRIQTIPAVRAVLSREETREKESLISSCTAIDIKTPDGVKLKAYLKRSKDNPTNKTILVFQGNNIKLPSYSNLGERFPDYHFLFFTYRGVDDSEGCPASSRDLFLDGDSVLQFAKSLDVPLFVCAWSLGAGIASNVLAAYPEDREPVILDRTFASTMKLAAHRVHKVTWLPRWLLEGILSALMWLTDWQIDTSAAVRKMSQRRICLLTLPTDGLMVEGVRLEEGGSNISNISLPTGSSYEHRTKLGDFREPLPDVWDFFRPVPTA